mgnify:CR=1 FL=1
MIVTRTSMLTGIEHTMDLPVTQKQLDDYMFGNGLIQNIFPDLTPDEREFIKTGVTPDEWDNMFAGGEYAE